MNPQFTFSIGVEMLRRHAAWYADVATVIGVIAAIVAFWDSANLNRRAAAANERAASMQVQATAVGVLNEYFTLAMEYPALANRPDSLPVTDEYEWFAGHAFFIAEAIFNLTELPEWRNTVADIVDLHHPYVRDGRFHCAAFNPDFVAFVRSRLQAFRCG